MNQYTDLPLKVIYQYFPLSNTQPIWNINLNLHKVVGRGKPRPSTPQLNFRQDRQNLHTAPQPPLNKEKSSTKWVSPSSLGTGNAASATESG